MNPRTTTLVLGIGTLAFGLAALSYPERLLGFLGFSILQPSRAAAALGEIRATYGGLFAVVGALTILAGTSPQRYRREILVVALLWLGALAGRLFGWAVDGNPGLPGWLSAAAELVVGGGLLGAWWAASKEAPKPAQHPGAITRGQVPTPPGPAM